MSAQPRPIRWLLPLAVIALAAWPVWRWLWLRVTLDSSEGWGVCALAAALILLWGRPLQTVRWPLLLPTLCLLLYAVAYPYLLPLARAVLVMTAAAGVVSACCLGTRLHLALWGLLLLALPVVSSLQFYLGYPLRSLVAALATPLLRMEGLAVQAHGTCLQWGTHLVAIDAPCSGVKMLWTGLALACALALWHRLSPGRTVGLTLGALALLLLGNVLRAAALFYVETGLVHLPPWGHSAVGMVAFLAVAGGILWGAQWQARPASAAPVQAAEMLALRPLLGFALFGVAVGLVPLLHAAPAQVSALPFPGWPAQFDGRPLRALPLSARERAFSRDFPGRLGRFSDGRREIVLRWVTQDTRKLHPAADCFRGVGYRVTPLPLLRAADGHLWSGFRAVQGGQRCTVRERIFDDAGHSWSDVSAWYWSAALHRTPGPWWAVTVVE